MKYVFLIIVSVSLLMPTAAMAIDPCKRTVTISLAHDEHPDNLIYRMHNHDVAEYAMGSRFGTYDNVPLDIEVGDGDWCFDFGTLRDHRDVLGDATAIAVTVKGVPEVRSDLDYNVFQVIGLNRGDTVTIEFLEPFSYATENCQREIAEGWTMVDQDGRIVPRVIYSCDVVEQVRWRVIEQRQYVVGVSEEKRRGHAGPIRPL